MDSRHRARPSQVRPRPPSTGRPAPVRMRPVNPARIRLKPYRAIERGPRLPIGARAMLAVAILALAGTVVLYGNGTLGHIASGLASGVGGVVDKIGGVMASPTPTAVPVVSDVPFIVAPDNPYTSVETTDVSVTVPAAVAGKTDYMVRLFDTVGDQPTSVLGNMPVGPTSTLVFPGVTLAPGTNGLQVALVGPDGEGGRSTVVTYVLDQVAPKVTIVSPKDGASISADSLTIKGTTQPASSIVLRDDANAATASTQADKDGIFSVAIATAAGPNAITITVTDPAGNVTAVVVHVTKGSGKLTVTLTGSAYTFKASSLPANVTFTAVVTGSNGGRVGGAVALFTITVPGAAAIVSPQIQTGADGAASFTTTIPAGATSGSGLASVLVTTGSGSGTARQALTIQ